MPHVKNKGGRPRLKTLAELRQQASPEVNKYKGGKLPNGVLASNSLKKLKEMLKLRNLTLGGG